MDSLLLALSCRECPSISAVLRFHILLIKPDVRFSRIRLSDRISRFRPREVAPSHFEPNQLQLLVQVSIRVACRPRARHLVLAAQPLSQPIRRVSVHGSIGFAHRPDSKVVRPPLLFVADTGNALVREVFVATGKVKTVLGKAGQSGVVPGRAPAGLNTPMGLAFSATAGLYIADEGENVILLAH